MKKVIFGAAVLALVAIGVFKATETNNYAFSDLQMENIEALAQNEPAGGLGELYGNKNGTKYCCKSGSKTCGAAPCPE